MILSVDANGRVVVTAITKAGQKYTVTKQSLIEPKKLESRYYALAARFRPKLKPESKGNDYVTLIAVANKDRVLIFAITAQRA